MGERFLIDFPPSLQQTSIGWTRSNGLRDACRGLAKELSPQTVALRSRPGYGVYRAKRYNLASV